MDADPTRISQDPARSFPPLLVRRVVARTIDSAIAVALACLIVLPFTLNQATDALLLGGFDSFRELLAQWDPGTVAGGSVGDAVEQLQPVVLSTIYLQAFVIWAYDWLSLTLTGTSIGKVVTRLRVTRRPGSVEPTITPDAPARWSLLERALRMALRAGLVVGAPALAAGMLLAAAFAVPGAVDLAELFIALSVVLLIVWLAGGVGLHGLASGTRVVGFEWQELRQEAEHQLDSYRGHADDYLRQLQEASRISEGQRAMRRIEHDPRVRSAAAPDTQEAASSVAQQLRQAYSERGLRGVWDSVARRLPGPGS